ncbi:MAG: ABC transporter permease [Candidatus Rokuibacteriota bacterium]|nr:MAG: ABC transporter permease [Candidatus Rokubacteria bacterium]
MRDLCWSLFHHRELIGVLVAKQLKLRYRGSLLGFLWTLVNPLLLMLVYTLVFSVYFRLDMDKYPAFLFTGLLPWIWFASSLQQGVTCILDGAGLVSRSQFPAEVLPVVTLTANAVNFLLTLPLLFVFLLAFRVTLGVSLVAFPILIGLEYLVALGLVLFFSALNVFFRDLQHIIVHLLTILQFLTPIFYPLTLVPEPFRAWAFMNPLTVLISAFQDVLFFNRLPAWPPLLGLLLFACVVLSLTAPMFARYKRTFAEAL